MNNAIEDFRTDCWVSMQNRVVGFWQTEVSELADLQSYDRPEQLTLPGPGDDCRNGLLIERPAQDVFRDDVKAAPHCEIGHC